MVDLRQSRGRITRVVVDPDGKPVPRVNVSAEVETETGTQIIRSDTTVIATGSAPVELPALPFGGPVISSTDALALTKLPEKLVVVGGGAAGCVVKG